ncbi:MAG: HD domain-containing protein [Candidatus Aenigmatarchaeota archaeon]
MRQEINDGIDRAFPHEPIVIELLDTPEVQRTEYINSTGFTYKAFPGLHYPRKTHLIGAAKWAQRAYNALQANGAGLPETLHYTLLAAAALHDIGHGPFSHALEDLLKSMGKDSHEAVAAKIVRNEISFADYVLGHPAMQGEAEFVKAALENYRNAKTVPAILKEYGVDNRIVAEILEAKSASELGENAFLKELLDGSLFDIDKMDYLPRDSRGANTLQGDVDPWRLLNGLRLVEADGARHLAIPDTALRDLCMFVAARKYMFAEVYTHRTVLKYEAMLIEAAKRANEHFGKSSIDMSFLTDDELFAHLTRANPVSAELVHAIKYGREFLCDEAYSIESSHVFTGDDPRMLKLCELSAGASGSDAEEAVRNRILALVNERRKERGSPAVEPHKVLVRMRYPYRSPEEWKAKLDMYIYRKKDPSTLAHLREIVDGCGPLRDSRARDVYYELCKPQTSTYCSIFVAHVPGLKDEAKAAAQTLFGL